MPQFNYHTPKASSTMRSQINKMKMTKFTLPAGLISENNLFSYGYDGDKYYVSEGVMQYLVTGMHLVLDEAKELFNALTFNDCSEPCTKVISNSIREARKLKIHGDDLFWFLTDKL